LSSQKLNQKLHRFHQKQAIIGKTLLTIEKGGVFKGKSITTKAKIKKLFNLFTRRYISAE
jgi:hypothetical protein